VELVSDGPDALETQNVAHEEFIAGQTSHAAVGRADAAVNAHLLGTCPPFIARGIRCVAVWDEAGPHTEHTSFVTGKLGKYCTGHTSTVTTIVSFG
jgi:hypothetical protein